MSRSTRRLQSLQRCATHTWLLISAVALFYCSWSLHGLIHGMSLGITAVLISPSINWIIC